jgi:hypothetical protein
MKKSRPFHFSDLFLAADETFLFASFADLVLGTTDLHQTFARFGFPMYTDTTNSDGSLTTKSKLEAMYLPTGPTTDLVQVDVSAPFHISPAHKKHPQMSYAIWVRY